MQSLKKQIQFAEKFSFIRLVRDGFVRIHFPFHNKAIIKSERLRLQSPSHSAFQRTESKRSNTKYKRTYMLLRTSFKLNESITCNKFCVPLIVFAERKLLFLLLFHVLFKNIYLNNTKKPEIAKLESR